MSSSPVDAMPGPDGAAPRGARQRRGRRAAALVAASGTLVLLALLAEGRLSTTFAVSNVAARSANLGFATSLATLASARASGAEVRLAWHPDRAVDATKQSLLGIDNRGERGCFGAAYATIDPDLAPGTSSFALRERAAPGGAWYCFEIKTYVAGVVVAQTPLPPVRVGAAVQPRL